MTSGSTASNAGKSLEDAFFAQENARLLEQLRATATQEDRRKALADVIHIQDEGLVDHLLELGLGPETVLAVTLIPLVLVAWADGAIEPKERQAILQAAAQKGIVPDSIAGQVLDSWLKRPLDSTLVQAWKRYIQTIWPALTPHERDEVRKVGLERARGVAEAAGGFLGLGSRISAKERAVLAEMEQLLAD
jgi:hypothetical protein